MVFTILVFIIVIGICFYSPYRGLVILLNINLIRNLQSINLENPCLKCVGEQDIILGGVLQSLGLFIIFFKVSIKEKTSYRFDFVDSFLLITFLLLILTSIISIEPTEGLLYSFKYLLLGVPYFFVTKTFFINENDFEKLLLKTLSFAVDFALAFGIIAGLVVIITGYQEPYAAYGVVMRLTIQGVHPIPFAQTIGFGLFSAIYLVITKRKQNSSILFIKTVILSIILLFTNTRGVLVSLLLSGVISALFYIETPKLSKKTVLIGFSTIAILISMVVFFIDGESILGRFYSDELAFESILLRFDSFFESFRIFSQHIYTGIGPTSFTRYSELPYPHNFFLEYIVFFGIWGILLSFYFIVFIVEIFSTTVKNANSKLYVFLFAVFLFYFLETQVSFTLWTHKGLYFSLGILMAFYNIKLRRVNKV